MENPATPTEKARRKSGFLCYWGWLMTLYNSYSNPETTHKGGSLSPAMVAEYQTQLPDKKLLQQKLHGIFENNNTEDTQ
ncbi:hypothetical protein DI53_2428 [Sphingobacterium deserti]|uniref:Uncharacterized protein n=2 Tax=Sphingobacterium deserti TaxID=1229276 RepID=A0A0B8T069_9SPHI|nr:hypothetical protein DI53_2428 [Sphingobacterium deserti]